MHTVNLKNLKINKDETVLIGLALLPGVLISIVLNNPIYLIIPFYSVCSIMPFAVSHCDKYLSYCYAVVIMLYSLLVYTAIGHWLPFFCLLAIPMTLFSIYERQNHALKTMSNWWLIGVVYAAFKIQHTPHLTLFMCFIIFFATLMSCAIALSTRQHSAHTFPAFKYEQQHLRYYIKYPLALLITVTVLALINADEGEWLIWSCFSVLSLNFAKARGKYKQRLVGVALGVSIGLVLVRIIPDYPLLDYIYIICILLSLRLFQSYLLSFTVRCFFIVLYAGSNFQHIGYARLTDIALGGTIGIVLSYILRNRDA